jgi:hypothetical protein
MKMYGLEDMLLHYSMTHQIVSFKVGVGIGTCIIDIILAGISLVALLDIVHYN